MRNICSAERKRSRILNSAFTLVELLVVIAIISILSALLFPVFARAKAAAKSTNCLSNLRNIGIATGLYANDADDQFPFGIDPIDKFSVGFAGTVYEADVATMPLVHAVLMPYVKNATVFKCPMDFGFYLADLTFPYQFNTMPSMFDGHGLSYRWNAEISLKRLTFSALPNPTEVNISSDASGSWHTGEPLLNGDNVDFYPKQRLRYNSLFGDLHVKNVPYDQLLDSIRDLPN